MISKAFRAAFPAVGPASLKEQREQQRAEAEYIRENDRLTRERTKYADALDS